MGTHDLLITRLVALVAQWEAAAVWESEQGNTQWAQALEQCIADVRAELAGLAPPKATE